MQIIYKQLIRFCFVGLIGSCLNYLVFIFTMHILSMQFQLAGILGFLLPIPLVYVLNKSWSFNSSKSVISSLPLYFTINLIALAAHVTIQYLTVKSFNFSPNASQIFGITGSASVNFLLSKYLAFRTT